jgi:hypothetical protein
MSAPFNHEEIMAHHYSDPNLVPDGFINRLTEQLGATGRYPEGKLNEHDEGEIAFAVAADPKHKKVLIDFGKPVAFLGMTGEQAKQLGQMLIDKAAQIDR